MSLLGWVYPPVDSRQVLALAGVAQAVESIDLLAETGQCPQADYARSVFSLLASNPESDKDVFGEAGELNTGLVMLQSFCEGKEQSRKARYLAQILYLQKRLMRNKQTLSDIASGIENANRQLEFYGVDSDTIALSLGDLYQNTLSTIGFRIQIVGNPDFLSQQRIAAKVRTLLFSGVRFALLWRQFGGRSRQLLLSKGSLSNHCDRLLKTNKLPENNNATD